MFMAIPRESLRALHYLNRNNNKLSDYAGKVDETHLDNGNKIDSYKLLLLRT